MDANDSLQLIITSSESTAFTQPPKSATLNSRSQSRDPSPPPRSFGYDRINVQQDEQIAVTTELSGSGGDGSLLSTQAQRFAPSETSDSDGVPLQSIVNHDSNTAELTPSQKLSTTEVPATARDTSLHPRTSLQISTSDEYPFDAAYCADVRAREIRCLNNWSTWSTTPKVVLWIGGHRYYIVDAESGDEDEDDEDDGGKRERPCPHVLQDKDSHSSDASSEFSSPAINHRNPYPGSDSDFDSDSEADDDNDGNDYYLDSEASSEDAGYNQRTPTGPSASSSAPASSPIPRPLALVTRSIVALSLEDVDDLFEVDAEPDSKLPSTPASPSFVAPVHPTLVVSSEFNEDQDDEVWYEGDEFEDEDYEEYDEEYYEEYEGLEDEEFYDEEENEEYFEDDGVAEGYYDDGECEETEEEECRKHGDQSIHNTEQRDVEFDDAEEGTGATESAEEFEGEIGLLAYVRFLVAHEFVGTNSLLDYSGDRHCTDLFCY